MPTATVGRIRRTPASTPTPVVAAPTPAKPVAKTPAKPKAASSPSARSLASLAAQLDLVGSVIRLRVLFVLAEGERFVNDLAGLLGINQPNLSHHLHSLRLEGLVEPSRRGRKNFYALTDAGRALQAALAALAE